MTRLALLWLFSFIIGLVIGIGNHCASAYSSLTSSSFAPAGSHSIKLAVTGSSSSGRSLSMEYIPSGMSKEQWNKLKASEQQKKNASQKNLGRVGITTFKSRSFVDWQKSGGRNLFPVDPTKVKDKSEIPYMQRPGGRPDGSDLKANNIKGGLFDWRKKERNDSSATPEPEGTNWWTLN